VREYALPYNFLMRMPRSNQGFRRFAVVLGLVTFLVSVVYFVCDEWKPSEEDSVAMSAQVYEDQLHACRNDAGSKLSECVAEAEKSYRATTGQVYRAQWSDALMDWSVYAVSSTLLSFLVAFAVRTIGSACARFTGSTEPLIPEQKRLILNREEYSLR
jgi:hypothetical protein